MNQLYGMPKYLIHVQYLFYMSCMLSLGCFIFVEFIFGNSFLALCECVSVCMDVCVFIPLSCVYGRVSFDVGLCYWVHTPA